LSVIISDKSQSNEVILKLRSAINLFIIDHGWIRAIINNNFYSINEGVYRSGQPSPKLLENYIIKHKIKNIINLRYSDTSDQDIYLMQKNLCHKHNTNDIELAKKQLSLKYLHISYSSTGILDYFFNLIENLELKNTELEDWIDKKYDPQLITSNYKLNIKA